VVKVVLELVGDLLDCGETGEAAVHAARLAKSQQACMLRFDFEDVLTLAGNGNTDAAVTPATKIGFGQGHLLFGRADMGHSQHRLCR
jgi:hypothetical protein